MAADHWKGLSSRVRSENLAAMKPLGSWERARLARDEGRPLPPAPAQLAQADVTDSNVGDIKAATTKPFACQPVLVKEVKAPRTVITAKIKTMSQTARAEAASNKTPTTKDKTMNKIRTDGTCGLCGKKTRTRLTKGEFCCATCENIRRAVGRAPQIVLAQLNELHPELLAPTSLTPVATPAAAGELAEAMTALADSETQNKALAASNIDLARQLHDIEEVNEGLRAERADLQAEVRRLENLVITMQNEITTVREDNQGLRTGLPPTATSPEQSSLAQANIRQVQKLREMEQEGKRHVYEIQRLTDLVDQGNNDFEAFRQEIAALEQIKVQQWQQIHDLLFDLNAVRDILDGPPARDLADIARQRMSELQGIERLQEKLVTSTSHNNQLANTNQTLQHTLQLIAEARDAKEKDFKASRLPRPNQPGPSQELLTLQGELAGLQDVLTAWEQERATLLEEQGWMSGQVRWLKDQLLAAERKAAGLEQEVDRLQECKVATLEHTTSPGEGPSILETALRNVRPLPTVSEAMFTGFLAADQVNQPRHYTSHPSGIECIQITEHMGFTLGNAVKYIWRADLKEDAIQDLHKAQWYINRELQKRSQGQQLKAA